MSKGVPAFHWVFDHGRVQPRSKQTWVALFYRLQCYKLVGVATSGVIAVFFWCPPPCLSFLARHPSSPYSKNEPFLEISLCSRRMTQPSKREVKGGRFGNSGGKNPSLSGPFMHRHAVLLLVHEMSTDRQWIRSPVFFFQSHS